MTSQTHCSSPPATYPSEPESQEPPSWVVVAVSAVSLAIAMGIGRFSFTPILPMMIADGAIELSFGSSLATSNYLGYLAGAMLCMGLPRVWSSATLVKWGLLITIGLTAGMCIQYEPLWLLLRLLSGAVSAIVFVHTTRWCLSILVARGQAAAGSLIFVGVGLGIALSGLAVTAMVSLGWSSTSGWLSFTILAATLLAITWSSFSNENAPSSSRSTPPPVPSTVENKGEMALFAFSYGLAGFGYIITATYLPVIARESLPPSAWLDLFWPAFGFAAVIGSLLATRRQLVRDPRWALTACYFVQAIGVITAAVWPTVSGFVVSSILAGLPFSAINFFAMDEVTRLRPHHAARYMGLLTALYGIGQIAGPPMVNAIMSLGPDARTGFDRSLKIAAASLLLGGLLYLVMEWKWPNKRGGKNG
ncbi:YbfB/YjiJ family MFS transporter [Alcaligenes sp. 13f]|uniref:YbfB/YjiJ family MFS transporter n=1 Tax=Alcaligenes sp. 13f TaxID=2841924 RepID=UPI001CF6D0B4|nr:YbfB/YjiJ family MFS transporter [Alcaligenes sp. 13f]MCB4321517.1 YbfB/YjiJ family MFS transporter [Alcaligenes sp. 13f]